MDQLMCDVSSVGTTVHYTQVALHLGLTAVISLGGGVFLGLGIISSVRARRARFAQRAAIPERPS